MAYTGVYVARLVTQQEQDAFGNLLGLSHSPQCCLGQQSVIDELSRPQRFCKRGIDKTPKQDQPAASVGFIISSHVEAPTGVSYGATALTLIPLGPDSSAAALVKAMTPDFAVP